jgi:misacylated tRNA(Ala) deacylase
LGEAVTELIFRDDAYARECAARVVQTDERGVQLDRTVFYAASGGQPGDTGLLRWNRSEVAVSDARKSEADGVIHLLENGAPLPEPGAEVTAVLDWERRHRHMRMHTALHLLCAVVPGAVTGGQIAADKGRLDFDLPATALDREEIEAKLNLLVEADHPVSFSWISDEEMADRPELVRTMSVKPPIGSGRVRLVRIGPEGAPVDLQPCGGTHVRSTTEIGPVAVTRIENKGKQNRRVVLAFKE